MARSCVIPAIRLPPAAKNPIKNGGIVHGIVTYITGHNPKYVIKYPNVIATSGDKINGIIKNGFKTTGTPNILISPILNKFGIIATFAIARLSALLENKEDS